MDKVYVVSSGDYSDYSIEAIYKTRELADQHVKLVNGNRTYDSADVEEWDLLDTQRELVPILTMTIRSGVTGTTSIMTWKDGFEACAVRDLGPDWFQVQGWDADRVQKVAGELLAEWKAHREGIA